MLFTYIDICNFRIGAVQTEHAFAFLFNWNLYGKKFKWASIEPLKAFFWFTVIEVMGWSQWAPHERSFEHPTSLATYLQKQAAIWAAYDSLQGFLKITVRLPQCYVIMLYSEEYYWTSYHSEVDNFLPCYTISLQKVDITCTGLCFVWYMYTLNKGII